MAKDHGGDWLPLHRLAEPSSDSSPSRTYDDEPPQRSTSQPRLHSPSDDQYDPLLGTSSSRRGSSQLRHVLRHGLYLLPRLHRRTLLILLLLTTGIIAPVVMVVHTMQQYEMPPMHHLHNGAMRYTPDWSHGLVSIIFPSPEQKELEAPYLFDGILQAPWPGGYPLPELKLPQTLSQNHLEKEASNSSHPLSSYSSTDPTSEPAAFLMLHIFSTPRSQSRHKRQFIRNHSPLASVPLSHRHLVEVKFVIGYPDPNEPMTPEIEKEEEEISRENEQYGDVIRLKGLYKGENMNNGKSWEWLRWVGRPGGRQAWWVLKCDDDTLPIMPNLLPFLTEQNPREPVYLGTALGHWLGFHYYMEGMMYGFSWGVVKTLAEAVVDQETITGPWDEDAKMGTMMFSLPSKPSCPPISSFDRDRDRSTTHTDPCDPLTPPMSDRRWGSVPISPDPRSGLVRTDVGNRIGFRRSWYVARWKRALAWHGFKDDETYLDGWKQLHRMFKDHGREYLWTPPSTLEGYSSS